MAKINIKAVSVISAIALATVSLVSVAAAQDTQTVTPEQSSDSVISVKAEAIGQTFSLSSLDMKAAKEDIETFGLDESDIRDISAMQSKALPRSINSEKAKEYIYDRMLNTMDFYKSLEGSYIHTDYDDDISYTVDYSTVNGENGMSYEKQRYKGKSEWDETIFKDGVIKQAKAQQNSAKSIADGKEKYTYAPENCHVLDIAESMAFDTVAIMKSTSRMQYDEEGIPVWYRRSETTGLRYARESISPTEMTFGFLSDFSCWDIDRQDTMLSRNCYVIKGALNDEYYSNKLNTVDFEFWVDAQTGVLLKYKCFSASGELVEELKTTSFVADKAIQTSIFSADWYDSMY